MANKLPCTQTIVDHLPDDFILGVATAAYQIEGAVQKDGRGPSIWDSFSHQSGNVVNNDTGDTACDHYHRWSDDLNLIQAMHVDAYRFSFSWSRVQPDGKGAVNEKGLSFYDQLIDGMLSRKLDPFATLYHWDLPLSLQASGGWTYRDTAKRFADFAALITDKFGDRLHSLTTFNEPWCSSIMGYLYGTHAPGLQDLPLTIAAIHNQHVGHGWAVQRIKDLRPSLPAGIVLNLQSVYPGTEQSKDIDAANRHRIFHNGLFVEPLFNGQYPSEFIDTLGGHLPDTWQDDLPIICQPLDYWGLNYYTPVRVLHDEHADHPFPASKSKNINPDTPVTDIGWEIDASAFTDLLIYMYNHYTLPPC